LSEMKNQDINIIITIHLVPHFWSIQSCGITVSKNQLVFQDNVQVTMDTSHPLLFYYVDKSSKSQQKKSHGCMSGNLCLVVTCWPAHDAGTGVCSRFLLEEAQCWSIDREAALDPSGCMPRSRGMFVCVCPRLLSPSHRTSIVMCLALCSHVCLGCMAASSWSLARRKKDR